MITRSVVAAALACASLFVPAYAADQPGTNSASPGDAGSTPQVQRGHFPHRKPGAKATNQGLVYTGVAFGAGFGLTLSQILGNAGGSATGIVPPVSGQ